MMQARPKDYKKVKEQITFSHQKERPFLHLSLCDNCDDLILGPRFKCLVCLDFDFCFFCFEEFGCCFGERGGKRGGGERGGGGGEKGGERGGEKGEKEIEGERKEKEEKEVGHIFFRADHPFPSSEILSRPIFDPISKHVKNLFSSSSSSLEISQEIEEMSLTPSPSPSPSPSSPSSPSLSSSPPTTTKCADCKKEKTERNLWYQCLHCPKENSILCGNCVTNEKHNHHFFLCFPDRFSKFLSSFAPRFEAPVCFCGRRASFSSSSSPSSSSSSSSSTSAPSSSSSDSHKVIPVARHGKYKHEPMSLNQIRQIAAIDRECFGEICWGEETFLELLTNPAYQYRMICRIATEEKEPKQKKKKQKKKEKKEKREEEKEGEERREKREEEKEEEEEEEEEIGGYVVCKLKKTGEGIDITSLAVRERHRGGGVGRDLILFTVNDAHFTLGVSNAVLHVEHSNLGARRLYERLGFFQQSEIRNYYGAGRHAFVMRAILPLYDR